MKNLFLSKYLNSRKRNFVRNTMRGYRHLKSAGELDKIKFVKEDLANSQFLQIENRSLGMIFGAGLHKSELIIRQYLLVWIADLNLNRTLLYALGRPDTKIKYALPREWRDILRKHGFKVSTFRSTLAWYGFILLHFANGFFKTVKIVAEGVCPETNDESHTLGKYVFFCDLGANNLPYSSGDGRSHDIITWYWQKFQGSKNLDRICHNAAGTESKIVDGIPTERFQSPLLPLNPRSLLQLTGWCVTAGTLAFIDIFRGRWWHALIFAQAVLAAKARLHNPYTLAVEYLFHNSGPIFRPLWTYEAEKRGSCITLYFYSTNMETFKRPEGYVLQPYSWHVMNWPRYMVWDQYQADFIKRVKGTEANISIVGPIWFQSSSAELPQLPVKSIAVFDVQPMRDAFYEILGADLEYYTPDVCNQFLIDISDLLKQNDITLVYKRKRKMGSLIHYKYRNLLTKLNEDSHFIAIDADIAAQHLIEQCSAVISMPFTSTALLGKQLGKPSIYYDPNGIIQKDDRAAHGIKVIIGREELNEWLLSVL